MMEILRFRHFLFVLLSRGLVALGGALLSYTLARSAGPAVLGQFTFAISVVVVASNVTRLGFRWSLMRSVARQIEAGNAHVVRSLLRYSLEVVAKVSAVSAACAFVIFLILSPLPDQAEALPILVWSLIPVTCLSVLGGYFIGAGKQWLGALLDLGGFSLIVTMAIIPVYLFLNDIGLQQASLCFLGVTSLLALAMVCVVFKPWRTDSVGAAAVLTAGMIRDLVRGRWNYTIIGLSGFIQQSGAFALVGLFLTSDDLGVLRAAERVAVAAILGTQALNIYIQPMIVQRLVSNPKGIPRLLLRSIAGALGLSLLPVLAVIVYPVEIMNLFGVEFIRGAPILPVLAVGQLLNGAAGPLLMYVAIHDEAWLMRMHVGVLCTAFCCLPLAAYFFGMWGFTGGFLLLSVLKTGAVARYSLVSVRRNSSPKTARCADIGK